MIRSEPERFCPHGGTLPRRAAWAKAHATRSELIKRSYAFAHPTNLREGVAQIRHVVERLGTGKGENQVGHARLGEPGYRSKTIFGVAGDGIGLDKSIIEHVGGPVPAPQTRKA